MNFRQRIKAMFGFTSEAQPTRDKLVFSSLFNSFNKKLAFCFVLFSGFLSLSDWSVWIYSPPSLNQLQVSEGELYIGWSAGRRGKPLYLIVNGEKIKFNCKLRPGYGYGCQFDKNTRVSYQGKQAKVWCYRTSNHGWIKDNRLYQLEINGKKIISYEEQKEIYLSSKSTNSYIYVIFFILSSLFFYILQVTNNSILNERKENTL